jgi:hypothetical protein
MRSGSLEQHGPEKKMPKNLAKSRSPIMTAQIEPPMRLKQRRQRAGNQQEIVEPEPKEMKVSVRFDTPPVKRVEGAAGEAQRVSSVAERLHSNAMITRPKPAANRIFKPSTNIASR